MRYEGMCRFIRGLGGFIKKIRKPFDKNYEKNMNFQTIYIG